MESRLTVRLPPVLHRRLKRLSKSLGLKRSFVVRAAIHHRYVTELERAPRPRPYELVKDLIGSLNSGIPGLGSRHREHLMARFRRRG